MKQRVQTSSSKIETIFDIEMSQICISLLLNDNVGCQSIYIEFITYNIDNRWCADIYEIRRHIGEKIPLIERKVD